MRAIGAPRAPRPPAVRAVRRPMPFPWWLVFLAVAVAGIVWWAPWKPAPIEPIAFSANGERALGPMCLVVMIDESGSMSDSDPQQARSAAVLGAASFLSEFGLPEDRIAAGWFADDAKVSDLMDGPTGIDELPQRSMVPSGGGTDMVAAVKAADQTLTQCDPGIRPVLALVSDGMANDFDALARSLKDLPPSSVVHLIAIDAMGSNGQVDEWRRMSIPVGTSTVKSLDREGVGDGMASLLSALTGQEVEAG